MKRKPKYTVEEIRERVAPVAKRYGVKRVSLFGSYARGDARAKSDVDLLIDRGEVNGMFKMCELWGALEESLQTKIDLLTTAALDGDEISQEILKEGVLLYAAQA